MYTLRQRVYFTRDQLPPIGVDTDTTSASPVAPSEGGPIMAAARAKMRLEALASASPPSGATNAAAGLHATVRDVKVAGDLVTVDFTVPGVGWGVAGSTHLLSFLQQIVYTASEEPGLRRVLITQNGGQQALIDQAAIDRPATRDALTGYDHYGLKTRIPTAASAGDLVVLADVVDWRATVDDVALGLGRFVVELRPTGTPPESGVRVPRFTAKLEPNTGTTPSDTHKWVLRLELPDAAWPDTPGQAFHCCPLRTVGKTPIREVAAYPLTGNERRGVGFAVLLDDPRPWRVAILQAPLRVVVDIGGVPQAVSESIALYAPPPVWAPGAAADLTRELTVIGLARTEGNIRWRLIQNLGQRVLAQGQTSASVGTSAVWGTFEFALRVPSGTTGELTLEVFWVSPRDGSAQGIVQVPLRVR